MPNYTTNTGALLTPAQLDALFLAPVLAESVAAQTFRVVRIDTTSFRIPRVTSDPSAAWVNEGQEIPVSDLGTDEITVTPSKLAGLTIISSELADDSSPEAAAEVGAGLARDSARKLDAAAFGNAAAPAPKGLASLTGATGVTLVGPATGAAWTTLDNFTAAVFEASTRNAVIGAWVAHPDDARALALVKKASGSQENILQPDPTAPGRSLIAGLPLRTSTAVTAGTVYGVPQDRAVLVVRNDVEILTDASVFFTSDRVAVRSTMRAGLAFPQPAAIIGVRRG